MPASAPPPHARLAELRRAAELAARGTAPEVVFAELVNGASTALGDRPTMLVRFEDDGSAVVLARRGVGTPVGARVPARADGIAARVRRTGRAERIDDFSGIDVRRVRAAWGVRAAVGVPVVVEERPWGVLVAMSGDGPLPDDTEERLAELTGVVSSTVAGALAWSRLRDLAEEQAALRRVAELVARGVGHDELFAAVAAEASGLVHEATALGRMDGERTYTIVAVHGGLAPLGARIAVPPDDEGLVSEILRTGGPVRMDDYDARHGPAYARDAYGVRASVGVPITVDERIWGVLAVITTGRPVAAGAEQRLAQFADLVAAAVAGAQARADLQQLADGQAALRRVAELVARAAPLDQVFAAVATEASTLLGDLDAALLHYDRPDSGVVVAACHSPVPVGLRIPAYDDIGVGRVRRTGRPFRVDSLQDTSAAAIADAVGVTSSVAVPVIVEGRVWGTLSTTSAGEPPPAGTEERLAPFAELAAAAIANAENRAKLTASRARVVATADEVRRRLQRDVHDSAQQRLVHAIVTLKLASAAIADGRDPTALVEEALRNAERAHRDLRDVIRGILPAALERGGLGAGLGELVHDLPVPVRLLVVAPRLSQAVETTAYFVVAEALTNIVKHAQASSATVEVGLDGNRLVIEVRDDGAGGADPARGSGLTGLLDRVEAGDGTLRLSSPVGGGTTLHVELPISRTPGWAATAPGWAADADGRDVGGS